MILCAVLLFILVQCEMQGLAQEAAPAVNFKPARVKNAECISLLDPAPDPNLCACNVLRGIPVGAIFNYPPTKGVQVDWDRILATVHYWKCFPKGMTLPPTDATEPNYMDSSEGVGKDDGDDYAAGIDAVAEGHDYD